MPTFNFINWCVLLKRNESEIWSPETLSEFSLNPGWRAPGWPFEALTECEAVFLQLDLQNLTYASDKLCKLMQLCDLSELQPPHLQNGNYFKFLPELVWRAYQSFHQKALSSWPIVIIKKKLWGHSESQEEVAVCIALEHSCIYFSLSIFRGNKVIFTQSIRRQKPIYPLLELPCLFDVRVSQYVLKDGMFMVHRNHKHSSGPGLLWICVHLTQGQRRRKSSSACVLTQRSFVFPLSTLCILHWKQTKHSSVGKYCDW